MHTQGTLLVGVHRLPCAHTCRALTSRSDHRHTCAHTLCMHTGDAHSAGPVRGRVRTQAQSNCTNAHTRAMHYLLPAHTGICMFTDALCMCAMGAAPSYICVHRPLAHPLLYTSLSSHLYVFMPGPSARPPMHSPLPAPPCTRTHTHTPAHPAPCAPIPIPSRGPAQGCPGPAFSGPVPGRSPGAAASPALPG